MERETERKDPFESFSHQQFQTLSLDSPLPSDEGDEQDKPQEFDNPSVPEAIQEDKSNSQSKEHEYHLDCQDAQARELEAREKRMLAREGDESVKILFSHRPIQVKNEYSKNSEIIFEDKIEPEENLLEGGTPSLQEIEGDDMGDKHSRNAITVNDYEDDSQNTTNGRMITEAEGFENAMIIEETSKNRREVVSITDESSNLQIIEVSQEIRTKVRIGDEHHALSSSYLSNQERFNREGFILTQYEAYERSEHFQTENSRRGGFSIEQREELRSQKIQIEVQNQRELEDKDNAMEEEANPEGQINQTEDLSQILGFADEKEERSVPFQTVQERNETENKEFNQTTENISEPIHEENKDEGLEAMKEVKEIIGNVLHPVGNEQMGDDELSIAVSKVRRKIRLFYLNYIG